MILVTLAVDTTASDLGTPTLNCQQRLYTVLFNHSLDVSRTEHSMQTGKQRLTRFRYHHIYITMALDWGCNNLTTMKVHMQVVFWGIS